MTTANRMMQSGSTPGPSLSPTPLIHERPTQSLEDWWNFDFTASPTAVPTPRPTYQPYPYSYSNGGDSGDLSSDFLPLIFLVVILVPIFLCNCMKNASNPSDNAVSPAIPNGNQEQRQEEEAGTEPTLEESKNMLNFLLEAGNVQLTLDEENFVTPGKDESEISGNDATVPSIRITELPNRQPGQTPTVSNHCAICLENYQLGDVITGSTNPDCQHAFHSSCIVGYLSHKATQKRRANDDSPRHPCPCCRNSFVTLLDA